MCKMNNFTSHQCQTLSYITYTHAMEDVQSIYNRLLVPSHELVSDIGRIKGDIVILGAGGKMGPALARAAKQAVNIAGIQKRIIAVARFSEGGLRDQLENEGIETIQADLLIEEQLKALPLIENVLYLAGVKFGTSGNAPLTWAMNSYLPGRVAQKFRDSNIVVFSTGNVYPMCPVESGGATEKTLPNPTGEYAQSCLGRERLFQYFSSIYKTPLLIYRLNFAIDTTYGVLIEIARSVKEEQPFDLSMGYFNAIWQGDANEIAIRSLLHCEAPPKILNVTGPETVSVRWAAAEFGRIFGTTPIFVNEELPTAYLSDASECARIFGQPKVLVEQMIPLLAEWMVQGGKLINKPTHFQERKGKY